VIANSPGELAVGHSRFLLALADPSTLAPVAAPDLKASLAFYDLARDPATPAATVPGIYLEAAPGRGLYRAAVDFDAAGEWGVQISVSGGEAPPRSVRLQFTVADKSQTPAIGDPAPPSDTPTASTLDAIRHISTDPDPDPDFYRLSVAQALATHRPFALVIATPQFCQTQLCGPTLDRVKALAGPFKAKIAFMHVEPYVLKWDGQGLQPVTDASGNFQLVTYLAGWHLPSEPWVFVVDGDGKLAAKFEGTFGDDELTAALRSVEGD
jgi:hypothetical protein